MGKRGEVAAVVTGGAILLSGIGFGALSKKEADAAALDAIQMPHSPDPSDGRFTIVFGYVVERGDTLWSIAEETLGTGTRFKEIAALNPEINPNDLTVGAKILVPYEPENISQTRRSHSPSPAVTRRPVSELNPSREGIDLIKQYEGFSEVAYPCPAGVMTIGYGHTATAREGMKISRQQAERLFRADLSEHTNHVKELVKVPLTQNEFDALVSFVFNLGPENLESSTLLRKLNQQDYSGAADEFSRWIKSKGKPLRGLIARRSAETELFRTQ